MSAATEGFSAMISALLMGEDPDAKAARGGLLFFQDNNESAPARNCAGRAAPSSH
jgi:hypothetical protein